MSSPTEPAHGLTGWRRRLVVALKWQTALCLLVVVVWVVLERAHHGYVPVRDAYVQNIGYLGAAALCASRAIMIRSNRAPWILLAAGLGSRAAANIYNSAVLRGMVDPPSPSWSDAGWLAMYAFAYAAVIALLRHSGRRWSGSTWLDGLICGAGAGSLAAALVVPLLSHVREAGVALVAVSSAYPVADLAVLTIIVTGAALQGWRPARAWAVLALGLVIFTLNDLYYLWEVAQGHASAAGHLTAPIWLLAATVMAWAAWAHDPPPPEPGTVATGWSRRTLIVPMVFAVASIGLLVTASRAEMPAVAVGLAVLTLVLVLARTLLALIEVGALATARLEAGTDDLTGLANRRSFQRRLARDLTPPGQTVTLLLIDLDRFKEVNDSLGHTVGDELLCLVARRIEGTLRAEDLLARLGGDEFAVLTGDGDRANAASLAERLVETLRTPFELESVRLHIDASVGIALAPDDATDPVQLLRRADVAMYRAKASGGGYSASTPSSDLELTQRFSLIEDLRGALARDELEAWFQPKTDLATGAIVGVEALVRWQHPERGLLGPQSFLPLALAAGLMRPLTEHVLRCAAEQVRQWRAEGLDLNVAVNIDAGALLDTSLPDKLEVLLAEHGLPARALTLEITEDSFITNRRAAIDVLHKIRELGLLVSLDDYGTGYSSMSYLRDLPIDELKIDRSFVSVIDSDQRTASIVASTVDLAHHLGITVVAEGIETHVVRTQLARMGCDVGQGYLMSRPLPAAELLPLLRSDAARLAAR